MTRFQVDVGNEFPLGERDGNGRRPPFGRGKALKVLLFLSLAAIVVSHPVHAAMIIALLLLLGRSPLVQRAQARWQQRWDAGERPWAASYAPWRDRNGHDRAFV